MVMMSDITVVVVAIVVVYITQWLVKRYVRYRGHNLPPGPRGLPLIGNIGGADHLALLNHRERFGDVSYLNILGTDIVVFNSITAIREALQGPTADVFAARPYSFIAKHAMYPYKDIIFGSKDTSDWKPLRLLLHSLLKQYGEGITQLENTVSKELEVLIGHLDSRIGEPFDVSEYLEPSLLNILSTLTIGERYDYDAPILQNISESNRIVVKLFRPLNEIILNTFPFLRVLPFGLGAWFIRFKQIQTIMLDHYVNGPKNRMDESVCQQTQVGTVYEMLKRQKTLPWLSDACVKGATLNTFAAGFTTSSRSLKAFLLLMLHHPDVQRRIQNEIDDVIGDRQPALADRGKMPYTTAAILEMTRHASILPLSVPHACDKDTLFRGFTIPCGAVIFPNLFHVHHDPELWENPWSFDPSRFLDDAGDLVPASHPRRANLIPFGVGKRVCMGEVFAKTRLFLYITSLLQAFTLEPTNDLPSCDPREMVPALVVGPVPFHTVLRRRVE